MIIQNSKKYELVTDLAIRVPDVVTYLVDVPATTNVDVRITLEPSKSINSTFIDSKNCVLTFADTNPDTIVRSEGSWLVEGFQKGQTLTITGTASNNTTYTVDAVTDTTITLVGGDAATPETVADPSGVSIIGTLPASSWFTHATITGAAFKFEALEYGPTGMRFVRTSGTGNVTVWVKG